MPTVGFWQLVVSCLPRPVLIPSLLVCSSSHHNYHKSLFRAWPGAIKHYSPAPSATTFSFSDLFSFLSFLPPPSFLVLSLVGIYFRPINCIGINWSGLFIHFINNLLYQLFILLGFFSFFFFLNSGGDVIRLAVSTISIDSSEKRSFFYSIFIQLNLGLGRTA